MPRGETPAQTLHLDRPGSLCCRGVSVCTMWPMPVWIFPAIYALAVARATRLVTTDRITEAPRERVKSWAWQRAIRRSRVHLEPLEDAPAPAEPMLAYLVSCPWCASIWIGVVAAPLVWAWGGHPWLWVPALALALSEVSGLLAAWGEK